jgi:hypothetical protein
LVLPAKFEVAYNATSTGLSIWLRNANMGPAF